MMLALQAHHIDCGGLVLSRLQMRGGGADMVYESFLPEVHAQPQGHTYAAPIAKSATTVARWCCTAAGGRSYGTALLRSMLRVCYWRAGQATESVCASRGVLEQDNPGGLYDNRQLQYAFAACPSRRQRAKSGRHNRACCVWGA